MITELTQDMGNRLLEGTHKKKLVCTRTQEKGAVTPQETDPDMPMSVQESPAEAWDLYNEVAIFFITSTTVWS